MIQWHMELEQGSPEWLAARLGIPTASVFDQILAKGQGKTRRTLMYKLLGERLTGEPQEQYSNSHMERGKAMEDEARNAYVLTTGNEIARVGFVRNGEIGASPDSMVGPTGLLEIKTKLPHLQIAVLLEDKVPDEHLPQIQGQMMVCEREWCDFVSYWPRLPVFVKRVFRDEAYIKNLRSEIDSFLSEMDQIEKRLSV